MKTFKKSIGILLAVLMSISCLTVASFAKNVEVKICVEGITKNLFDGEVTVSEGASALDALRATGLELVVKTSDYGSLYVSSINGEAEKTFGGWDGWLFEVNDVEPTVAMDQYTVSNNDYMLVYYGDPYGVGMQYPIIEIAGDYSSLTFTSEDTAYDPVTWEPTTAINPIAGATVTIDGNTTLITNDEGWVQIPEDLRDGEHSYKIERYAESGLPTVLRTTGTYGQPAHGDLSPLPAPLMKIINWIYSFFLRIVEFFKGLVK